MSNANLDHNIQKLRSSQISKYKEEQSRQINRQNEF